MKHSAALQSNLPSYLRAQLLRAQNQNKSYSLRSFSQKLGVAPGTISQIINGKRRISIALALRILSRLDLDVTTKAKLMNSDSTHEDRLSPHRLVEDQFSLVAEWYHYAILSLMLTQGFKSNPGWISKRLGISENQANSAINRMKQLGILSSNKNGVLKFNHNKLTTTDNVSSAALKKAHTEGFKLAERSLQVHSVKQRDFTFTVVPTNPRQIELAKLYLRNAQQEACRILMDTPDKTEVYRLSFSLFPLTELCSGGSDL